MRQIPTALTPVPDPDPELPVIAAAVEETIEALACPKSDAAVVALARTVASTIDAMPRGQKGMMLGQTAPLLLKVLQELEDRAAKRRARAGSGRPNRIAAQRATFAAAQAKRRRVS